MEAIYEADFEDQDEFADVFEYAILLAEKYDLYMYFGES